MAPNPMYARALLKNAWLPHCAVARPLPPKGPDRDSFYEIVAGLRKDDPRDARQFGQLVKTCEKLAARNGLDPANVEWPWWEEEKSRKPPDAMWSDVFDCWAVRARTNHDPGQFDDGLLTRRSRRGSFLDRGNPDDLDFLLKTAVNGCVVREAKLLLRLWPPRQGRGAFVAAYVHEILF